MIGSVHWFFQMIVLLELRVALRPRYSIFKMERINYVDRLVNQSDGICVKNLRMNMGAFHKLCYTLESRGYIRDSKHMNVVEQVAVFLYILAHHKKMSVYYHVCILVIQVYSIIYEMLPCSFQDS